MLSPKKYRELLGKEYDGLSDVDLAELIAQLTKVADIFIDLAMGNGSKPCEPPSLPSPSPDPQRGRKKALKRPRVGTDDSKGNYCEKRGVLS